MHALLPSAEPVPRLMIPSRLAAEALGISERTLWDLTAPRGPIPCVRIGKAVRYRVAALEEFARGSESTSKDG